MNQRIPSEITFLAVPFAGGDGRGYRSISSNISGSHRWITLELPGRGKRVGEDSIDDIKAMAQDLKSQWRALKDDGPYAIFGHSMGALVTYEMVLSLAKEGGQMPEFVYLAGCRPPNAAGRTRFADLDSADFWREMARYIGFPDSVLKNEPWKAANEKQLRNDCRAMENYPGRSSGHKVPVPIYYRIGEGDSIAPEEVDEWRKFSSVSVDIRRIPGDHFFIHTHPRIVAQDLSELIHNCTRSHD